MWTVPGEEGSARPACGRPRSRDLPLAEIHDHLVPYHAMQIEDFVAASATIGNRR